MIDDPVVEEIRQYRQAQEARHGYDLHTMCEALRAEEQAAEFNVVYRNPKRC